ncbi:MAG: phosphate acyltransferase [Prolixibacteraceae bacterium]|jgi:phosphate butyryltransferase|nr:phosphate acyltransferase [Prolixibacteraceae bacterium]
MEIRKLSDLFSEVKSKGRRRLVVVNAVDAHSVEAVHQAISLNIVSGILTGDRDKIIGLCHKINVDPGIFTIIPAKDEQEAASEAVKLIKRGEADIIMKGLISTDKYMRALLNKEYGLLPPGGVLGHVTVIENPVYHKLLVVSDVAVIPYPSLEQKVVLVNYLIETARALGVGQPKVALIAASEQVLPSLVSCTDAAVISGMYDKGYFPGAIVAGPMALDVAVDRESAEIKQIVSPVAGDADCLLFPNIDAGNVFYKANTKLCKSEQAAVVVGATVPAILSSRGDSMQTKLNSVALAAILCK